jgi:hypothetical protein
MDVDDVWKVNSVTLVCLPFLVAFLGSIFFQGLGGLSLLIGRLGVVIFVFFNRQLPILEHCSGRCCIAALVK